MKRTEVFIMVLLVWGGLTIQVAEAQQLSRADAIARIAELYPNSDASPEQIYEEGRVWQAMKHFSKQLKYKDLIALTGILEADRYHIVPNVKIPVDETVVSTPRDSSQTRVATKVLATGEDTSQVVQPERPEFSPTRKVDRRIPEPGKRHFVTIASRQDESSRQALRTQLSRLFDQMPFNVLIDLEVKRVSVGGSQATVMAEYAFIVRERDTRGSQHFKNVRKTPIVVHLERVGEQWLVTDLTGFATQLATVFPQR